MRTSSPRAVFIDFDGTLAHWSVVPQAHREVVAKARANGHKVFLCTGRAISMVTEDVLLLFDGIVGSAGAYIKVGEQVIMDERYPAPLAAATVAELNAVGAVFSLEAPEALFSSPTAKEHVLAQKEQTPPVNHSMLDQLAGLMVSTADLGEQSFAKISVWVCPVPIEDIAAAVGEGVRALPSSVNAQGMHSGELQLSAIDKSIGVALVAQHLGLGMEHTIGIGDGLNDLEMLEAAGVGVAVIGADQRLVDAADFLIPGPQEDGLVSAFERLALL